MAGNPKTLQRSFTGGEMSPAMYGRIDDQKYQQGLKTCRNFVVLPQGPVRNRSGFEFVNEVKYSDRKTRLIPFKFSSDQTMVIELGDYYARFHTEGGTLMDGTAIYEIATPYAAADVMDIHYCQSGDVVTLVHPGYSPRELRRYGALDWRLVEINFGAPLSAPTGVTATYTCNASTATDAQKTMYTLRYRVTAVKDDGSDTSESAASETASTPGNVYLDSSKVEINWTAVSGATRYYVYKTYSGIYGYIGATEGTSFTDTNIAADNSKTPPRYDATFGTGNYPGAVSYFDQRRVFGGTYAYPQHVWLTRTGTESDMSYTLPTQSDNRIKARIAALEASRILHLAPLQSLLVLTSSAEFRTITANDDALTPTSIGFKPQSYIGANNVQPVISNNTLIYAAGQGGHVRELGYNWQASGFVTGDLSIRAAHLFEDDVVVDMANMKAPVPIVWCVTRAGSLLGCTYVPEQSVGAWHRHDTKDGLFESVACVQEGDEDILYAVIKRTINGSTKRYVERMHERTVNELTDSFFVDAGATYSGSAVKTISGLDYLEGETVAILADGAVVPSQVVTDGKITLTVAASHVVVGLPIEADMETLPLSAQTNDGGYAQARMKNIVDCHVRVYRSAGLFVGPSFDALREDKPRRYESYGTPPALKSEEIPVKLTPSWNDAGTVCIRQSYPLPLTVIGITSVVAF